MSRSRLQIPQATRQDIRDVLAFTLEKFGLAKAQEYASLIRLALNELVKNPRVGRPRRDIHPDAWVYPIARPGRNARHHFLYETGFCTTQLTCLGSGKIGLVVVESQLSSAPIGLQSRLALVNASLRSLKLFKPSPQPSPAYEHEQRRTKRLISQHADEQPSERFRVW